MDRDIRALAFSPDGKTLAVGSNELLLWDVECRKVAAKLEGHTGGVSALAFAADGKTLVSGGRDGKVLVWDVAGRRVRTTIEVQQSGGKGVRCVAVTSDGKRVASGSGAPNVATLWDAGTGKARATLNHTSPVKSLSFSANGLLLATVDAKAHLWELKPGQ